MKAVRHPGIVMNVHVRENVNRVCFWSCRLCWETAVATSARAQGSVLVPFHVICLVSPLQLHLAFSAGLGSVCNLSHWLDARTRRSQSFTLASGYCRAVKPACTGPKVHLFLFRFITILLISLHSSGPPPWLDINIIQDQLCTKSWLSLWWCSSIFVGTFIVLVLSRNAQSLVCSWFFLIGISLSSFPAFVLLSSWHLSRDISLFISFLSPSFSPLPAAFQIIKTKRTWDDLKTGMHFIWMWIVFLFLLRGGRLSPQSEVVQAHRPSVFAVAAQTHAADHTFTAAGH